MDRVLAGTPASLGRRFAALLVDWLLCLLIGGLFGPLNGSVWPVVVLVGEYTFFVGLFGRTPGMYMTRIHCVSVGTGGPLGLPRAALRAVLLALLVPALIMDGNRRGLHDRAAGSIMLMAPPPDPPRA
jgi:uncharacterized RDD family membrane protein YckC